MNILDPRFKYTPACATTPEYLRAKFDAIRRQMKQPAAGRRLLDVRPSLDFTGAAPCVNQK